MTVLVVISAPEAPPTVLIDASAGGVPFAATAVGGLLEVVGDGGTGWLVPRASADLLAATLTRALTEPQAHGTAARLRAEQPFDAREGAPRSAAGHQLVAGTASAR